MKNLNLAVHFLAIFLLLSPVVGAQNRISLRVPTAAEEAAYIFNNLRDLAFFEKHGYQVSFPQMEVMDSLFAKARAQRLTSADSLLLEKEMREHAYRKADYAAAVKKIESRLPLVEALVKKLRRAKRNWKFRHYDTYTVRLTLYGPGGSYHPQDSSITLFTTPEGKFKQYDDPANTLIHEIVHLGVESSWVQLFELSHPDKEMLVDKIVFLRFQKFLPDYRIQHLGDSRIEGYLVRKSDIGNLFSRLVRWKALQEF